MPPKRTAQTTRGDARRAAFLEALAALIEDRPIHEITIGEIADHAGATRSVFYFYFPTKGAAIAALLEQFTNDLLDDVTEWFVDRKAGPRERVLDGTRYTVDLWRSRAKFFVALLDAEASDPQAAQAWADFRGRMENYISALIENERAAGIATPGPPARPYVRLLLGMNWHAFEAEVRQIVATGQQTPDLAETITELWVRALYTPPHGD